MNAGMKNGINLLMILVLFISCVQEKEDNNVLRRVEACMELFPDSALSLLSQIECPECMRGQQRADYALLLTQALDKNYLDNLQSDSLIMIAVEYYKQEGDKLKAGKAYFYYVLWKSDVVKGALLRCYAGLSGSIESLGRN